MSEILYSDAMLEEFAVAEARVHAEWTSETYLLADISDWLQSLTIVMAKFAGSKKPMKFEPTPRPDPPEGAEAEAPAEKVGFGQFAAMLGMPKPAKAAEPDE